MFKSKDGVESEKGTKDGEGIFYGKNFRKIIGVLIVFAVILIAGKICYTLFFQSLDSVVAVYDKTEKKSTIYLNSKRVDSIGGDVFIYSNMDRSTFYIMDGQGTIYHIKGGKLVEIMRDCQYITVANHNETALLINEDSSLFRYDGSKITKITDKSIINAVVSGDGTSYAYMVLDEDSREISYIGIKPDDETKIEDASIYAISETGDYLYGTNSEGNLLSINKKGEKQILAEFINADTPLRLNEDGTEIMFIEDYQVWLSIKGQEKIKIMDNVTTYTSLYGRKTGNAYVTVYGINDVIFFPMETFKNSILVSSPSNNTDSIFLISDNYEAEKLVEDVSYICGVDKKASKLYYLKDNDLCYIEAKKDAKERVIAEEAGDAGIFVSDDCKDVYLLDYNSEIYYIKDAKEAKKIELDLEFRSSGGIAIMGGKLYQKIDGEFYYINGTKAKKLKEIESTNYDESAGRLYAYDKTGVYEIKNGKLKKLNGDFKNIESVRTVY